MGAQSSSASDRMSSDRGDRVTLAGRPVSADGITRRPTCVYIYIHNMHKWEDDTEANTVNTKEGTYSEKIIENKDAST